MTGWTLVLHRDVAPGIQDTAEIRMTTLESAEDAAELMRLVAQLTGMEPVAIVPLEDE
jgi:hypothetical protein